MRCLESPGNGSVLDTMGSRFDQSLSTSTLTPDSGMARIFTAAPGLVKLMSGEEWSVTGLPEVYRITPERLEGLQSKKPGPAIAVI